MFKINLPCLDFFWCVSYIIDKIMALRELAGQPPKVDHKGIILLILVYRKYVAFALVLKHLLYLRILLSFLGKENEGSLQHNSRKRQMNQSIWVFRQEIISIFI